MNRYTVLLHQDREYRHIFWLGNLFMSIKLATYLETFKIGCTGTARTTSGIWSDLIEIKRRDKRTDSIPWGTRKEAPTVDEKINMMAWKDNALVLMLSSTHQLADGTVIRTRKRPYATSTSAKTAIKVFGDQATKELPIPIVVDLYSHNMNGVDRGDQLKASYSGERCI